MRVRMLKTAAGPAGVYGAGETLWIADEGVGRALVAAGAAEELRGEMAPPVVESAAVTAPERAVAPVQAARPAPKVQRKRKGA
jgi:hypothetical protein